MKRFGSIGMGNMGSAIVDGAVRNKAFLASEIGVFDLNETKMQACKEKGYTTFKSPTEVYEQVQLVLLAVKPQNFEELLGTLKQAAPCPNQILITIAAGISIAHIQQKLGGDTKVIRVMPNTPLLIGEGACAFSRSTNVGDSEFEQVLDIFRAMGEVVVIDESQMETIVPANGSSPAFVYYFIRALADHCERAGIDRQNAINLICKTFIGSAKMVLETGVDLDTLIQNVCSPGGATLEAIKVFDEEKLSEIIDKGCKNCVNRAKELGK